MSGGEEPKTEQSMTTTTTPNDGVIGGIGVEVAPSDGSARLSTSNLSTTSRRTVRLVYCSDGVVEECDEDIEEQKRAEKEARERELEERKKMDLEAVRSRFFVFCSNFLSI